MQYDRKDADHAVFRLLCVAILPARDGVSCETLNVSRRS